MMSFLIALALTIGIPDFAIGLCSGIAIHDIVCSKARSMREYFGL